MFFLVEPCTDPTMLQVMGIVKFIMRVICIIVPIVMIVLGTIDLFKAVTAGKEEEIKKKQKALITRLIAGILVFLVPTIVTVLFNLIGYKKWHPCWNNAKDDFSSLFNDDKIQ